MARPAVPHSVRLHSRFTRQHKRLRPAPLPCGDRRHRAARCDRAILGEDRAGVAFSSVLIPMLDQKPIGPFAAGPVMLHADENPAAVQTLSLQHELEVATSKRFLWRLVAFGLPISAVPELNRPAAIFALGDRSLEVPIVERVILDLNREPLVMGIERWPAGHSPRFKDTIELKPKIVMQPRCGMLLDDKPPTIGGGDLRLAAWLRSPRKIPLGAVF